MINTFRIYYTLPVVGRQWLGKELVIGFDKRNSNPANHSRLTSSLSNDSPCITSKQNSIQCYMTIDFVVCMYQDCFLSNIDCRFKVSGVILVKTKI